MKVFGERLKELRKEKGLSGAELGSYFDMSRSGISNWEVRDREPSLDVLKKLASFFNVSIDYLIGVSDIRNPLEKVDTKEEINKYVSINLIKNLIENNNIADPENIPKEIVEMIMLALKNDIKMIQKN